MLNEIQEAAFASIKLIELEKSGIRDGDGYWHGGDVLGGLGEEVAEACARLKHIDDERRSEEELYM